MCNSHVVPLVTRQISGRIAVARNIDIIFYCLQASQPLRAFAYSHCHRIASFQKYSLRADPYSLAVYCVACPNLCFISPLASDAKLMQRLFCCCAGLGATLQASEVEKDFCCAAHETFLPMESSYAAILISSRSHNILQSATASCTELFRAVVNADVRMIFPMAVPTCRREEARKDGRSSTLSGLR